MPKDAERLALGIACGFESFDLNRGVYLRAVVSIQLPKVWTCEGKELTDELKALSFLKHQYNKEQNRMSYPPGLIEEAKMLAIDGRDEHGNMISLSLRA